MNTVTKEEYWSIILNDPTQIGQITTEDTEFNRRINDVNLVLSNTFINTSDENLISKWETSLYIDGIEGKTITERKADILYTLCEKNYVPVSIIKRFLLNLIGDENKFVIEFIKDENKLIVYTDRILDELIMEVSPLLESVVPQFIDVVYTNYLPFLPDGFTELTYLMSTGTQEIIGETSQLLSMDSFEVRVQAALPGNPAVSETAISSTVFALQDFTLWVPYNYENNPLNIRWDFPGNGAGQYYTAHDGIYEFSTYKKQEGNCYINGELVLSTISTPTEDNKFGLFVRLSRQPSYNRGGQVAWVKIGEQGNEKLHLVAALDDTGAPCMYDLVNRTAYYNSGTGDFLYPTESTTFALRRVLPDWGKLTEHGLRRLYHVPANYKGELYDYALENGYKHIVESEKPEEGYWEPHWTENEDEIVLEWVEAEPPSTEDFNLEQPTEF